MTRIFAAALCATICLAGQMARAESYAFTLSPGSTDTAGFFGPVGGDLSGKTAVVTIDYPSGVICAVTGTGGYNWCNGADHAKTTATVTINGHTQRQTMATSQGVSQTGFACLPPRTYNGVNLPQSWGIGSDPDGLVPQDFQLDYYSSSYAACPATVTALPPALALQLSTTTNVGWSIVICSAPGTELCSPSEIHTSYADSFTGQPGVFAIAAVNPYQLKVPSQADIDLATALGSVPDTAIAAAQASALAADGVSAFIVLLQTSSQSSVTFSVTGGASLLKYDPVFLQTAPKAGAHKIAVAASAGVTINGLTYIPVLVQGALSGAPNYKSPIVVTAVQDGNVLATAVNLVPPPLVAVHGLWGGQSTFASFVKYISKVAPWSSQTNEITSICYSKAIGFNQLYDPLSVSGDPCEVTATSALSTAITSLLANDTQQGVVASRVDLVVHSMGGLAARFYSSQPGFRSVGNRNWGQFNHVITLDTPELGSALAPFLLSNLTDTLKAGPSYTAIRVVWRLMCGSSFKTATLLQCFANLDLPVSYVQNGVEIGAVNSLDPNGPAISALVSPAIPNATWSALSAQAGGGDTLSDLLNHLIAGTTANPDDPTVPTLDSLLGTENDEIVALGSQQDTTAGPAASVTLQGLQHTSVIPKHISDELGTNDDSVVDDPSNTVNAVVRCWLEQGGTANCQPSSTAAAPPPLLAKQAPGLSPDAMAPTLPATMQLGHSYRINLHLAGPRGIAALSAMQIGDHARVEQDPVTIDRAAGIATVTPETLGPISVDFNATDIAGDILAARARTNVILPAGPPAQFSAHDLPLLAIDLATPDPVARLHPSVRYAGMTKPIPLDARYVTLQAVPEDGREALTISPTGLIRGLRPGRGSLIVQLGNATARLPYSVIDSRGTQ
jgi:hypothetical protein